MIAYAYASPVSVIFYCYMTQNKQSHRHLLCSLVAHDVLFAYPRKLNMSIKNSYKNSIKSYIVNLSDLCNSI